MQAFKKWLPKQVKTCWVKEPMSLEQEGSRSDNVINKKTGLNVADFVLGVRSHFSVQTHVHAAQSQQHLTINPHY